MTKYEKRRAHVARLAAFMKPKANSGLVAKNTLVLYFRMIVVMFVGLYTGRVTLQALGVEDYGLQGVALGVVGMITFVNISLSTAASRFLTVEMGRGTIGSLKRSFATISIVQVFIAVLFALALETVGVLFLETKLNIDPSRIFAVKWVYHCAVVTTFLNITQVPYSAILIAHERMGAFAYMAIYDAVAKLSIAFALLHYGGDKLILLANLSTVNGIVVLMIYRVYCIRHFSEARFRFVFDKKLLVPVFSFAGWHIATQMMIMLLTQGTVMLNQRYFGPTLVAAISVGQVLNAQIQHFIGNFKTAANPQIIKLYAARQFAESKRLLTETIHFSVFLLLIFGVPAFFYADEALRIWLGANVPERASVIAKITLVGAFFSLFDVSLYVILYAAGRIRENMLLNVVLGPVMFGLIFYQIRCLHNPLASVMTLAAYQVILGLVNKPILLHFIAGYSFMDFVRIFVPAFKALGLCAVLGYGVRWLMPTTLGWAIPSSLLIAFVNAVALFVCIADNAQRKFLCHALEKVPGVGSSCAVWVRRMVCV